MQTVEWEESKKKVVETGKFKKRAEPGRDGAGCGSSFRCCRYLWIWAMRKRLVGVVWWGLSELGFGLGVGNGGGAV